MPDERDFSQTIGYDKFIQQVSNITLYPGSFAENKQGHS